MALKRNNQPTDLALKFILGQANLNRKLNLIKLKTKTMDWLFFQRIFNIKRWRKKIAIINDEEQKRYPNLLNLAGYIFLAITIIDYIFILYPLQLFNASWEFQTLERLVESAWTPILGGLFIFFPKNESLMRIEKLVLTWLSFAFLFLAILYFLAIPLILGDAVRINNDRNIAVEKQINEQTKKFNENEQQIQKVTKENLAIIIANNPQVKIDVNKPLPEIKSQLSYQNKQILQYINDQFKIKLQEQNSLTKRTAIKLILKTILIGSLLMGIFSYAAWVRF